MPKSPEEFTPAKEHGPENKEHRQQLFAEAQDFIQSLEESWEPVNETHDSFIGFFTHAKLQEIIGGMNQLIERVEELFGHESPLSLVLRRLRDNAATIDREKNEKDERLGDFKDQKKVEDDIIHLADKISIINEMRATSKDL